MKSKIRCKGCNKYFTQIHGNQVFCSDDCANGFFKKYRKEWKKEHPEKEVDYTQSGHRAYNNIVQRCTNNNHPSFHFYGGRGIKVEMTREEFIDFYFSSDVCGDCGCKLNDKNRKAKDGRTAERVDPERNYSRDNLRLLCRGCNSSKARGIKKKHQDA